MQGWKHVLVGTGFLGFSAFQLVSGGSFWMIGLPLVASGYFYFRAFAGQTGAPGADLSLAIDFIRDPIDTVFDEAAASPRRQSGRGPTIKSEGRGAATVRARPRCRQ